MTPSVNRLHLANVKLPGKYNPPTYRDTRVDVYAYLVLTDTDVVLIDTGVGEGHEAINRTFEPSITPLSEALGTYGVSATDVNLVVNSHLHFDHCGNNRQFRNARIFVHERELRVARTRSYTIREWFDYDGARLVPVSTDTKICPGVTLVPSPGHTPGHQSVLVETARGNVLVAAQAAFTADEYQRGGDPEDQAHDGLDEPYRESIAHLKSLAASDVYFSHDMNCAGDA